MEYKNFNSEIIADIIQKAEVSDKKDKINEYIAETCKKCVALCDKGENLRVLNEVYFMMTNLIIEFNL